MVTATTALQCGHLIDTVPCVSLRISKRRQPQLQCTVTTSSDVPFFSILLPPPFSNSVRATAVVIVIRRPAGGGPLRDRHRRYCSAPGWPDHRFSHLAALFRFPFAPEQSSSAEADHSFFSDPECVEISAPLQYDDRSHMTMVLNDKSNISFSEVPLLRRTAERICCPLSFIFIADQSPCSLLAASQ